jgi:hypothetical protein
MCKRYDDVSGGYMFLFGFTLFGFPVNSRDRPWIRFDKHYLGSSIIWRTLARMRTRGSFVESLRVHMGPYGIERFARIDHISELSEGTLPA